MRPELRAAIIDFVDAANKMPLELLVRGEQIPPFVKAKAYTIWQILPRLNPDEQLEIINSDFALLVLICVDRHITFASLFVSEKPIEAKVIARILEQLEQFFVRHTIADRYRIAFGAVLINLLDLSLTASGLDRAQYFKKIYGMLFEQTPLTANASKFMTWLAKHQIYPLVFLAAINSFANSSTIAHSLAAAAITESAGISPLNHAAENSNLDFILFTLNLVAIYYSSNSVELPKFERGITTALLLIVNDPAKLLLIKPEELIKLLDYLDSFVKPGISTWMYAKLVYSGFEKRLLAIALTSLEQQLNDNPELATKFNLSKYGVELKSKSEAKAVQGFSTVSI